MIRLTNNILSTAQQLWLRKLGGAKPVVSQDGGGIISAGQAKRSERNGERLLFIKASFIYLFIFPCVF